MSFMRSAGVMGDLRQFDPSVYFHDVAVALILVGVLSIIMGSLGCYGGIGDTRTPLTIYSFFTFFFILTEVGMMIGVPLFEVKTNYLVSLPLWNSLKESFQGANSSDVVSAGWNVLMVTFECCGVTSYRDFLLAKKWDRKVQHASGRLFYLNRPIACCKWVGTPPDIQLPEDNDIKCAFEPTEENTYTKGCLDPLLRYLEGYKLYLGLASVFLVLYQVIMLLLARGINNRPHRWTTMSSSTSSISEGADLAFRRK